MSKPSPDNFSHPRIAYLLADAGITLWDSKKGCSIHARSVIKAFEQEGCKIDVYVMRAGKKNKCGQRFGKNVKVKVVHQSSLTRWWLNKFLGRDYWRWLCFGKARQAPEAPNWMIAVGWMLWHRDFYRSVARLTQKHPPDLIYARSSWFSWPYAALKKKLSVPMFLEVNSVFSIEKADRLENAFDGYSTRCDRAMYEASERILPVSALLKEQIKSLGIEGEKIDVTPNAVDLELFSPQKSADRKEGSFIIGAVNSMRAYHGMGTLLRAARLLRDKIPGLGLLLIGGGFTFDEVKQDARDIGVDDITEFTGIIDHSQVPVRLRECAVCAAPYEGEVNQYNCPMKLYEYMALKVPIVASDWGDIPNIVRDGQTALLHRPGDPQSLADTIESVWRDQEAARQRVENAYENIEQHSWRAIVQRIIRQARAIAGQKQG